MAEQRESIVRAVGLTKVFRDFWGRPKAKAVNDISFTIEPGEVIGLLGPNGSGKSTTVKMLLGLLYPTGGILNVLGRSPRAVETKREIGYLPEESYLYKYLTAEETLDFFGSLFNLSRADRKKRIDQLLDMVGMAHARRRRVGEYSKGMARRIGLAQAMINDPEFLILDEPTSGLDPLGCKEVKDLILTLKARGKTVLITSHLLSDIEDVCDRVIILYGGKVRAMGGLGELLTVSDENRIVTPALPQAAMNEVLKILRENLHGEEFTVDHPRRTLEEFFLDVITKAKSDNIETAGVSGGGKIAEYLSKGDEKSAVLESLVQEIKPPPPREPAEPLPEQKEETVDRKLEQLTEEPKSAAPEPETPQAKPDEKLKEADAKLNDILGNRK
ncbi:ABC transporter ATP-binding protein [Victivallis lenta]|jgi:ABC-2 type transport system ATP-binding protein|uniref:ABC transporter ATP-binding protein n=1 Tax=Victivallis lenta TaxID=2606640 RepID=UPI000E7D4375|nr:ABC transporter ATP-binding protein [uncultured Victivallis sp.]MBS5531811.1 ABC transporter ATP-binding protein [bacterium]HBP07371.1 ABC transporter ATP-binding protein [Lentisphaeria bacterium]HCH86993.1 ABC transporter ATP-binding protein [Lentisphaeria bacterium]